MRPLPHRRRRAEQIAEDAGRLDPLPRLRRRCIIGAYAGTGAFIAAFTVDLIRHSQSDDMPVIGVEMAAAAVFILSVFTMAAMRIAAQNTIYALSIWKTATRAAQASAAAERDDGAVPIDHGREIRRRRGDRQAG